jgi:hypothetical protein
MASMLMTAGEVITVASGIYEGYDKTGPFIVVKDFDLSAFVDEAKSAISEEWEVSGVMYEIPRMLVNQGSLPECLAEPSI